MGSLYPKWMSVGRSHRDISNEPLFVKIGWILPHRQWKPIFGIVFSSRILARPAIRQQCYKTETTFWSLADRHIGRANGMELPASLHEPHPPQKAQKMEHNPTSLCFDANERGIIIFWVLVLGLDVFQKKPNKIARTFFTKAKNHTNYSLNEFATTDCFSCHSTLRVPISFQSEKYKIGFVHTKFRAF